MEQLKIGQNIQEERLKKGFSCRSLAKKLNLAHTTISRWEKGETCINSIDLVNLCKVLNVSIQTILGAS